MISRIIELLTKCNVLSGNEKLLPITIGISGAGVFSVEDYKLLQ